MNLPDNFTGITWDIRELLADLPISGVDNANRHLIASP